MDQLISAPDWPMLQDEHGWPGRELMSNFDHEVDHEVAQRLRSEEVLAGYPGWNFYATCWFADGQFHAEVSCHGVHRATISAETPEKLMKMVSEAFGSD